MYRLPLYVREIIERLEVNGYQAYVVGGAVRDMVMGMEPEDYDLTTDCLPEKVEDIFKDKKTILVGRRFGTINIVNHGENIEVTTFRIDGKYSDGRRPEEVKFSRSLEEDLKRRDFTINSLAYNPKEGLIDLFNGVNDIEKGIVRTVGNPMERFEEDYLRILRCIRFASRFKFTIEKETFLAIRRFNKDIGRISCERVREELFKMLMVDRPSESIRLLDKAGILDEILPEIYRLKGFDQKNPNHTMDVYDHSLCVMDNTERVLEQRLAGLFHDIGKWSSFTIDSQGVGHFYGHNRISKNMAKDILRRLNVSNRLNEDVGNLIHYHMNGKDDIKRPGLKRLIRKLGEDNIYNLFSLQIADTICSNNRSQDIEKIKDRAKEVEVIISSSEVYNKEGLNINGRVLIEAGYKEGREIGIILDYLLEKVLEDDKNNRTDILLDLALSKFPL